MVMMVSVKFNIMNDLKNITGRNYITIVGDIEFMRFNIMGD